MSLKIDYEEVEMAMSSQEQFGMDRHYLDRQTGEVLFIGDWALEEAGQHDDPADITDDSIRLAWYQLWYDGEVGEELPEAEERAMAQQVDAYLARFLEVPQMGSHDAYQDMVDFTDTVADPHLSELLYVALDGRGAFRRFKDTLFRYPDERERWFAFSSQRWRERIDEWLRDEGVLPAGDE
jgi:hypothetical protein